MCIRDREIEKVLEDGRKEIEEAKKETNLQNIIKTVEEELRQAEQRIKMELS